MAAIVIGSLALVCLFDALEPKVVGALAPGYQARDEDVFQHIRPARGALALALPYRGGAVP